MPLRIRPSLRPWWRLLPTFPAAVTSPKGLIRLVGFATVLYAVSLLCQLASHTPFVGPIVALAVAYIIGGGLRVAMYFAVLRSWAFGADEMPRPADFRDWWDSVFVLLLRFTLATSFVWLPAAWWAVHTRGLAFLLETTWDLSTRGVAALLEPGGILTDPVVQGMIGAGIVYFPAAVVAAAIGQGTLVMLNPWVTLRMILRVPAQYLALVGFLLLCLAVDLALEYGLLALSGRLRVPVLLPIAGEALGVLVPIFASMMVGRFLFQNAERLGYLDPDQLLVPAVPGAVPRGVLQPTTPGIDGTVRPPPSVGSAALREALERREGEAALRELRSLAAAGAEPDLPPVLELCLAGLLERSDSPADAAQACRRAARSHGEHQARALFTLARLLADKLGDTEAARQGFRTFLERHPADELAAKARDALRRLGEPD